MIQALVLNFFPEILMSNGDDDGSEVRRSILPGAPMLPPLDVHLQEPVIMCCKPLTC